MPGHQLLVDTDVLIDFLRRKAAARDLLEEAVQTHDLHASVITLAEVLAGMRPAEKEATEALLEGLVLLPVTEAVARKAGELRSSAKNILLPDCLIAATALIEECPLLTFNRKDYPFHGLRFYPSSRK
jgi:predicted nucleic acid-binding protein